nr:phytoene desaturase [Penicillium meliponae]
MNNQLGKFETGDIFRRFIEFLEESRHHYDKSLIHVLRKDFPRFLSLLRPAFLPYLFQLHPFQTTWQRVSHFFRSPRLQQGFGLASLYLGMSPLETPGTYTLLQYAELVGGIWYPKGGFHRVVESLVNIGSALGVTYHLSSEVKEVTISNGKASGVLLQSGEFFGADIVIINADLLYAYNNLLPSSPTTRNVSRKGRKASCSTISFYWSLSSQIPQLGTHNMFVEEEYGQRYSQVYMRAKGPFNPSFYVHVPSRVDLSASPPGTDAVIALVLVEHMGDSCLGQSTFKDRQLDTMVQKARNHVIASIESRTGISGFKEIIKHEIVNTPKTWEDTFNSAKGSVFGFDHTFFNILSFRPKIKHDSLQGVYFVGASVHPGAGVPTCLAGAKLCAERVLRDLNMAIPWASQRPCNHSICKFANQGRMFAIATIFLFIAWLASLVLR